MGDGKIDMFYNNARYWIWLSKALGYKTPKVLKVREFSFSIAEFYECGESRWRLCPGITEADIHKLKDSSLEDADKVINRCLELGVDIITFDDERYPQCLLNIYAPPCVLYVNGVFPDFDNRFTVGIVGTRNASKYGLRVAYDAASNLTRAGALVISGGALGIDSAAHRGALAAGGDTVCVLGVGIDVNYIGQNTKMREYIVHHGCLVTEYPPGTQAKPYHFPARNRIISAFSDAVLVVEAAKRSGALITAGLAQEQGKEVFAVMGNINAAYSEGTNALIKDGAFPYTHYTDIIDAFPNVYVTRKNDVSATEAALEAIPVKGSLPKALVENRVVLSSDKQEGDGKALKKDSSWAFPDYTEPKAQQGVLKNRGEKDIDLQKKRNDAQIGTQGNISEIKGDISNGGEAGKNISEKISSEARRVYDAIGKNETVSTDDLCIRLGLLPNKLLPFITELEIEGLVVNAGARNYKRHKSNE